MPAVYAAAIPHLAARFQGVAAAADRGWQAG